MDPRAVLQQEAELRGFLVAWAPIELPSEVQARYQAWVAARHEAGMGQLARAIEVRFNPTERLAWARSVMILAAPHAYPDPGAPPGGVRIGRVARVFWVREYEFIRRLIEPHLEDLKDLGARLGVRCRDYVEQGPLSLRSYAALSGLGWIGRNGMLIRSPQGSYLTLALLLTSLPVEEPPRHPEGCGSCRLCLRECPTGALLGDGLLDANKCVSYWTTQHPDLIPPERWEGIGDWLYGCDDCQSVCPWNKHAETFWHRYQPEPELAHPDLQDFLTLSEPAFRAKYRGSAFDRTGRIRMARNALIVLANTRDPAYLPLVRRGAEDRVYLVRATAAWALAKLGDLDAVGKLRRDPDPRVRREAERALTHAEALTEPPNCDIMATNQAT
jgi:epoxyqueuosine reductase